MDDFLSGLGGGGSGGKEFGSSTATATVAGDVRGPDNLALILMVVSATLSVLTALVILLRR